MAVRQIRDSELVAHNVDLTNGELDKYKSSGYQVLIIDASPQKWVMYNSVTESWDEITAGFSSVTGYATEAKQDDIIDAINSAAEASVDSGTATGGSNTTIVDSAKNFGTNIWQNALCEVVVGSVGYIRSVVSNTATTITISALPVGVTVIAGCVYSVKLPVEMANIARIGNTAQTGRDWSSDFAKLDIELSQLSENIVGATPSDLSEIKTSTDAVKTSTDAVKTSVDNVKTSIDNVKTSTDAVKTSVDAVKTSTDLTTDAIDAEKTAIIGATPTSLYDVNNTISALRVVSTLDTVEEAVESLMGATPVDLSDIDNILNTIDGKIDDILGATPTSLNDISNSLSGLSNILIASTPYLYNVSLSSADTEYSQAFPTNCKKFSVSIIDGASSDNFRIAFETGKVATPTAPYLKYKGDLEYYEDKMNLTSKTIYIASSAGSKVAQLLCWV